MYYRSLNPLLVSNATYHCLYSFTLFTLICGPNLVLGLCPIRRPAMRLFWKEKVEKKKRDLSARVILLYQYINFSHFHSEALAFFSVYGFSCKGFHVKPCCFFLFSYFIVVPLISTVYRKPSKTIERSFVGSVITSIPKMKAVKLDLNC